MPEKEVVGQFENMSHSGNGSRDCRSCLEFRRSYFNNSIKMINLNFNDYINLYQLKQYGKYLSLGILQIFHHRHHIVQQVLLYRG